MFELILFITLLLPLGAAAVIGLNLLGGEKALDYRQVQNTAIGALFIAMVGAAIMFVAVLIDPSPREVTAYTWFTLGEMSVDIGFMVDSLSALMALMISGFSFLIGVFSKNYMHNDDSFSRYFAAVMLFVFAMLILVLGNNFILLFVGWESVGLCSYLLIGHFYQRKSAAAAGTKAFVMNRVGDAGFLAGIFLIIMNFQSVQYTEVFSRLGEISPAMATAIALCLLCGAIGKSAQFPLGTWLARAMEGPTPSSALIHAATMVTAGVYMIVRSHELYDMAPVALAAVTIIGAITAIMGALNGMTNSDIKGILASSTVTQLGLMFVACGLGAYPVAVFHLVAHAFLKTYLFLTAPSILGYFHSNPDPKAAAGSPTAPVPVMFWFVLIGSIGLIGGGFGITAFGNESGLAPSYYLLIGIFVMGLFATLRHAVSATQRIFGDHGHDHGHDHAACGHDHSHDHSHTHDHSHDHAHEPTRSAAPILIPVLFILGGAIVAALIGLLPGGTPGSWFQDFLAPVVNVSPLGDSGTLMSWVVITVLGLLMLTAWAASIYTERYAPELPGDSLLNTRGLYVAAQKRFWLDDFYHKFVVGRSVQLGRTLEGFDRDAIDAVTGTPSPETRSVGVDAAWEASFLAARAQGMDDVLGKKSDEEAGLLARLEALGAEPSGAASAVTADEIPRGSGFFGRLTEIATRITGWIEKTVFDRLHGGVARTGGSMGGALYRIEEMLGRPAVLGVTVIAVVGGIILGVML
ncbi:NADH-ubiquinone oxidoreductase chain L [Candidatus Rhodobacter oscarellae]|uniref:NADH-ubiquinone oxidoreductase chain L n=1 Tax=Candidatus Rhodobacter oscarellae TaxID=1675527 RepID=A0A0J9EAW7_9RHOB|nr:NADH-quinone oxidoreductase subunit L [Candidatus Rhodobacter lobularis]KMW59930.1 NADH-ubiquinone oxidoreductase chain L [Candidatus Rhodobacter lobularis]